MGNRLARSPKKRKAALETAAAASEDGVAGTAATVAVAVALAPQVVVSPRTPDASASSHWPPVVAAIHEMNAFAETETRGRPQRPSRACDDPTQFFQRYDHRQGDATATDNDSAALQYAHALLVAYEENNIAGAVALLRPLAERPVDAPLAAEARVRLAQCLLILDPTLATNANAVERLLLEGMTHGEKELLDQATELLASVALANGDARRAVSLLDAVVSSSDLVAFQRACGRHLASMDDTVASPMRELPPLLMADVEALAVGPQ